MPLTVGVEEEFQLLDPATGRVVSRAVDVLAAAAPTAPGEFMGELPLSQVETATAVCATLDEVDSELRRLRVITRDAARAAGVLAAATGTPPAGDWREQQVSDEPTYAEIIADKAYLITQQLISGMHVHVGVPSPDAGITVMNGARRWLPVLCALTVNSPFWLGDDTDLASYRTAHWGRWPVSGPPPPFADRADYDRTAADLVAMGAVVAPSNIYWDIRPSSKFPTIEFRVMDVCQTVDEAVVITGLVRAIAATALRGPVEGPDSVHHLRAATWRAARFGLADRLVLPGTARLAPAADVVQALLDHVGDALAATGDGPRVRAGLARLLAEGTGADRQRAAHRAGGFPAVATLFDEAFLT